jgi:hypothetical protein
MTVLGRNYHAGSLSSISNGSLSPNAPGIKRRSHAGLTPTRWLGKAVNGRESQRVGADGVNFRWLGPLALLAVLVIGDQIRINRPGHKYRLIVEVETPKGVKSGSGVLAVYPDRSYSRGGHTTIKGDAVLLDLGGGKNLVALLAHIDKSLDLDGVSYVALRAYRAAGRNVSFNEMGGMSGAVPVTGALIPVLVTFADLREPASAHAVQPDELELALGKGFRLHGIAVEVVPNGLWPLDFGGALGEPVTRGIEGKLPWLNRADAAAIALRTAGLPASEGIDPKAAFTRK